MCILIHDGTHKEAYNCVDNDRKAKNRTVHKRWHTMFAKRVEMQKRGNVRLKQKFGTLEKKTYGEFYSELIGRFGIISCSEE